MADLISKLVPILRVKDVQSERAFYEQLGLHVTYEGSEYPGFIAVGNESIEFGLSSENAGDPASAAGILTWQLGVTDVDAVIAVCERISLEHTVTVEQPGPNWRYRTVTVHSPNGFEVVLEGEREA
jgi:catechol 2,3-dioxygenase-like lactoylglutathione lyase family enzyme